MKAYADREQYQKAVESGRVVVKHLKMPELHLSIAQMLAKLGKNQEAIEACQTAIQINRHDPRRNKWQAYHLKGTLLEKEGHHDDAIKAYKQAVRFSPKSVALRMPRIKIMHHHELGDAWEAAVKVARPIVDRNADNAWNWLRVAPALALAGDEAAFRDHCRRMIERFANSENHGDAEKTCKVCCLLPGIANLENLPVEAFVRPLELGATADWIRPWLWSTRALVSFRAGDADSAIRYLSKSKQYDPADMCRVLNMAIQALAQSKLAQLDDARKSVDQAVEQLAELNDDATTFHDRLIVRILLNEAERSIASSVAQSNSNESSALSKDADATEE